MNDTTIGWIAIVGAVLLSIPGWWAIYSVRRHEPPTAYATMEQTIQELSDQVRLMHRDMTAMRVRIAELSLGISVLSSQIRRLNHEPEWKDTPPPQEAPADDAGYDTAALHRKMLRAFNIEELNDLAYQMKIDTGELGENTKTGRVRSIIQYADRRGELPRLIALCRRLRPKANF